jgi:hypothetical protein
MRSLPSGLNSGTISRTICSSSADSGPSSRSRASIRLASLPSTSPAWIPFRISTTGRPLRCAACGLPTPRADRISSGIPRPSGLRPKFACTSLESLRLSSSATKRSTSSCRDVSR